MNDPDHDEKPGSVLPDIIGGATAAGIGVRVDPGAAILLGGAGYLFGSLARHVWDELRPEARRRETQVLTTAGAALDCDAEELGELIGKSECTRLQAGIAMAVAERTTWPPKIRALGRVLAEGLIAEKDAVDVPQFALGAMTDLDRLHVSLLELLVRFEPGVAPDGTRPRPYEPLGGGWASGRRSWTEAWILDQRPHLRPVFTSVVGTLVRHGLAEQTDRTREAMEQLGKDFREQLGRQATLANRTRKVKPATLRPANLQRIERSWSPTEMGERILGYFLKAGAELSDLNPAPPDDS